MARAEVRHRRYLGSTGSRNAGPPAKRLVAPALQNASPLLGRLGRSHALTVDALTLQLVAHRAQDAQPAGRALARKLVQGDGFAHYAAVKPAPDDPEFARISDLHARLASGATQRPANGQEPRPLRDDVGRVQGLHEPRDDPPHAFRPK